MHGLGDFGRGGEGEFGRVGSGCWERSWGGEVDGLIVVGGDGLGEGARGGERGAAAGGADERRGTEFGGFPGVAGGAFETRDHAAFVWGLYRCDYMGTIAKDEWGRKGKAWGGMTNDEGRMTNQIRMTNE